MASGRFPRSRLCCLWTRNQFVDWFGVCEIASIDMIKKHAAPGSEHMVLLQAQKETDVRCSLLLHPAAYLAMSFPEACRRIRLTFLACRKSQEIGKHMRIGEVVKWKRMASSLSGKRISRSTAGGYYRRSHFCLLLCVCEGVAWTYYCYFAIEGHVFEQVGLGGWVRGGWGGLELKKPA